MKKVCYVLGAGFSAYAGLPVMSNFIERAKDIYYSNDKFEYNHEIKKALDSIREYAIIMSFMSSNLYNIEELLSIAEMKSYTSPKKENRKIKTFIKSVIQYYENKFFSELEQGFYHEEIEDYEDDIHSDYLSFILALFEVSMTAEKIQGYYGNPDRYEFRLLRQKPTTQYSIISFNYDTILETMLEKFKSQCINKTENMFFNRDRIENNSVRYCKLHGSIDNDTIIPPTWAKTLKPQVKKDWIDAHTLLKEANEIRIIGFSFPDTDNHVSYLFKSALIENDNLKAIDVICLDNKKRSIEEKYHRIFCTDKFRFENANVGSYFMSIRGEIDEVGEECDEYAGVLEKVHSDFF